MEERYPKLFVSSDICCIFQILGNIPYGFKISCGKRSSPGAGDLCCFRRPVYLPFIGSSLGSESCSLDVILSVEFLVRLLYVKPNAHQFHRTSVDVFSTVLLSLAREAKKVSVEVPRSGEPFCDYSTNGRCCLVSVVHLASVLLASYDLESDQIFCNKRSHCTVGILYH